MISQVLKLVSFAAFALSTPVAMWRVFVVGDDALRWAIINSYGFSLGMCGIYMYPFVTTTTAVSWRSRLNAATMNWIIFLTCFTEIVFQIPHTLAVHTLHAHRGTIGEWPFRSYGLSDSRWSTYDPQPPLVTAINVNDAGLGVCVLAALLWWWTRRSNSSYLTLVLTVVFRDATLFRETVEYMYEHHHHDYPFTTTDPMYRSHAIACLWCVNILWIVAPLLTCVWAYGELKRMMSSDDAHHGKPKQP